MSKGVLITALWLVFLGIANSMHALQLNKGAFLSKRHTEADDCKPPGPIKYPMLLTSIISVFVSSVIGLALPRILISFVTKVKKTMVALLWFSTGIILSTALTHTLIETFNSFSSECFEESIFIHDLLHDYYKSFPGLVIMLTILLMHMIQIFSSKEGKHSHCIDTCEDIKHETECANLENTSKSDKSVSTTNQLVNQNSLFSAEFGMVLHSLLIGFSIGSTDQYDKIYFITAINFHQLFEGMGLASKMTRLRLNSSYWIVSVMFSSSVSAGIIIGAIMKSINLSIPTRYFANGVFGAISSGVLLHCGLIDLGHLGHDHSFVKSTSSFKCCCFLCLYVGIALMSVLAMYA